MFHTILIANRGEIAARVIRTARRMGIGCVAVYSDADAGALHVRMADRAVRIGPAPVAQSYLRGDLIIAAALEAGAQAVHPGYGFLSENPDFVEQVEAAGLVFIGPSAAAIRAMGLKDAAKRLMADAGVPVVPGYHGAEQEGALLEVEAARIGYPVLIKAVAGGGGKGMRLVEAAEGFAEALESARVEALSAFGNDAVLIEKYVQNPRHIEVQVFGDGKDALHLFERDCSLQRRHQKVIEEAPAPGMTEAMRAAMGDAAVRAAKAIGYSGAGTVEFIVDATDGLRADRFWFMEMNTRLQVEHPVTEAITGVDLVEWQLRVAAGEGLPCAQAGLAISGHAVEARLYAEDVPAGFLPATGRVAHLAFGPGLRVESGVAPGDEVSPWYDPMIAKLVAHAPDRAAAIAGLRAGLARTEVAGVVTNLGFLRRLLDDPGFGKGQVDTGLIARGLDGLAAGPDLGPGVLAQAGMIAAGLWDGAGWLTGFTLWAPLEREIVLEVAGEQRVVRLRVLGPNAVDIGGAGAWVQARRAAGEWRVDGALPRPMRRFGDVVTVLDGGAVIRVVDPLARDAATGPAADRALAPMPGLVRAVLVAVGDTVAAGERMVVLEAMKMEHALRAPRDGVVAQVAVAPGAQVVAGALLVLLEPVA